MKKLNRPIREYFDKDGKRVRPGDIIVFDGDGTTEKVYLAEGTDGYYELGINASNEAFLERHPEWSRELYPLYQFNPKEYKVVGHEDQ